MWSAKISGLVCVVILFIHSFKSIYMFHYIIINQLNQHIALDSSLRKEFDGYASAEKAYMHGLSAKIENRLSDFYVIYIKSL